MSEVMTAKDIISRAMLKRLTTDLAHHLLRLKAETIEVLETQNQRVEYRRADLVARMRGIDGKEFLLHLEVANNNTANMPLRMLRYYTDIRFAGHPGPIRQFLIYIGAEHMLTQVEIGQLPSFTIGFGRGKEEGREEGKAQVVHRLLSRHGAGEVSELLGLSVEDIERIAAKGGDREPARDKH